MQNYSIAGIELEMAYPPSKEQIAAGEALIMGDTNIVLDAKAGAGKTTTIQILTDILLKEEPEAKILMIAFNKSIVEELQERMNSKINIRTSHSLGMSILNSNAAKRDGRLSLNGKKVFEVLQLLVKVWEWDMEQEENQEKFNTIRKLCDLARLNLCHTPDQIKAIAAKHDLEIFDKEAEDTLLLMKQLEKDRKTIDFVDMIYKPYLYADKLDFPKYDYVFVDECQDLTIAQQKLMQNCIKEHTGRFIAVGDPSQAIYGFMGADADSFKNLQKIDNTATLPLNECYRCTKAIIKFTQEKTGSEIIAFAGNQDGEEPRSGSVEELKDGDFVMCRNTYPLVKLCFHLLGQGIAATVRGRDIGANLQNIIKASKRSTLDALYTWMDKDMTKRYQKLCKKNPHMNEQEIKDLPAYAMEIEKHHIIKLIAQSNDTVRNCEQLKWKIQEIFTDNLKGGILLSTIHKAKGLEFDRCFIIEKELMPSKRAKLDWQLEQERNLEYVCYTRAKKELIFIEDWTAGSGYSGKSKSPARPESKHVGIVGEKTAMKCKIIDTMEQEGDWGTYTLYEMEDEQGNIIVKFGTISDSYMTGDDTAEFTAEVKQHKEFRGENRTIIGRLSKFK